MHVMQIIQLLGRIFHIQSAMDSLDKIEINLRRMQEIAELSAGPDETLDRRKLQAEFDRLKREIDRIAGEITLEGPMRER